MDFKHISIYTLLFLLTTKLVVVIWLGLQLYKGFGGPSSLFHHCQNQHQQRQQQNHQQITKNNLSD